jgi:hypothetical protein
MSGFRAGGVEMMSPLESGYTSFTMLRGDLGVLFKIDFKIEFVRASLKCAVATNRRCRLALRI